MAKKQAPIKDRYSKTQILDQIAADTGLSRKHAIPLLEYLDRARVTRRHGNDRLVT